MGSGRSIREGPVGYWTLLPERADCALRAGSFPLAPLVFWSAVGWLLPSSHLSCEGGMSGTRHKGPQGQYSTQGGP